MSTFHHTRIRIILGIIFYEINYSNFDIRNIILVSNRDASSRFQHSLFHNMLLHNENSFPNNFEHKYSFPMFARFIKYREFVQI